MNQPCPALVIVEIKINVLTYSGNDLIHDISARKPQELRIELEDFNGHQAYAQYATFYVGPESENFQLRVGGYNGTAGELCLIDSEKSFKIHFHFRVIN